MVDIKMDKVEVPQGLMEAIHDYFLTRPMGEVENLVQGLRQIKNIKDSDKKETD